MYAETSVEIICRMIYKFLGRSFPGNGFRRVAQTVQIRDVIDDTTYLNGTLHSFNDQPAHINANGNCY